MFGRKKKKMVETIERLTRELESSKNEKESMRGEIDAMRDTLDHALENFKKSGTSSANATTTTITSMDADDLTRSLMVRETEFLSVIKNMTGLFETASADNRAVSENVKVLTDAYLKMNETVVSLATEVQKLQLKIDTLTALPAPLAKAEDKANEKDVSNPGVDISPSADSLTSCATPDADLVDLLISGETPYIGVPDYDAFAEKTGLTSQDKNSDISVSLSGENVPESTPETPETIFERDESDFQQVHSVEYESALPGTDSSEIPADFSFDVPLNVLLDNDESAALIPVESAELSNNSSEESKNVPDPEEVEDEKAEDEQILPTRPQQRHSYADLTPQERKRRLEHAMRRYK